MVGNDEGANVHVTGTVDGLHAAMKEAQESVKSGTEGITGSFEAMSGIIEAALAPLVAFFALFEGLEFLVDAVEATAKFGEEIRILGLKTGMTAEEITALQYASDQADVSVDSLRVGMQRLARAMEEAQSKGSPLNDVFAALGVHATDSSGQLRPMHDVLLDLAERFSTMEDGAGKTAIAMQLFGRSGSDLIPLLNEGRNGIEELEEKARSLGVTMGTDAVNQAQLYDEQMKELRAVTASLTRAIGTDLMPVLITLAQWFEDSIGKVTKFADEIWRLGTGFSFIKQMQRDLQLRMMLEAASKGGAAPDRTPAPIIPDSSKGPSLMDKWVEELNVIKDHSSKDKEDMTQMEIDFWRSKLEIAEAGSKDYIAIHSRIIALQDEQNRANDAWAQKQSQEQAKLTREWQRTLEGVPKMFSDAIRNMKGTAGTFRDFMREMWYEIVAASASALASMVAGHYAAELAKRGITKAGAAERVLTETGAAISIVSIKIWEGLKWIAVEAAKAAASAWSALAGIPVIGPALGVLAAAATIAGVLALAKTFSAFNGFDVPSNMNPMTQLHSEEMVLPKEYANVIRGMANGGGGGGGATNIWNIQTMDASTFEAFAKRHGGAIYRAAFGGGNTTGRLLPGMPGRGPA